MPRFPSRRVKAAKEIINETERYLRGPRSGETDDCAGALAGIVMEYRRTIVGALTQRPCWCERCERLVIPIDDGDDLCPHCKLVL